MNSPEESPYKILGIPENASKAEITKAYRKLAMKWHPDRNKAPEAEKIFKDIKTAYESLTGPRAAAAGAAENGGTDSDAPSMANTTEVLKKFKEAYAIHAAYSFRCRSIKDEFRQAAAAYKKGESCFSFLNNAQKSEAVRKEAKEILDFMEQNGPFECESADRRLLNLADSFQKSVTWNFYTDGKTRLEFSEKIEKIIADFKRKNAILDNACDVIAGRSEILQYRLKKPLN